jgi:hypothetical protein
MAPLPTTRAVQELSQIPFAHLIGSPLKAVIEAQALAAQTTIEFIQKVGFKAPTADPGDMMFADTTKDADAGEVRNITLSYSKKDENDQPKNFSLTVPILTITPIPYIRVAEVTIDFQAKLTDSIERNTSTSFNLDTSVKAGYSAFWSPVKVDMRVSATFNTKTSEQASQRREYSMQIHVRAVQDEMPAGLSKILDLLEKGIKEEKKTAP